MKERQICLSFSNAQRGRKEYVMNTELKMKQKKRRQRRLLEIIARTSIAALIIATCTLVIIKSTKPATSEVLTSVKIIHAVQIEKGDTLRGICDKYMDRIHYDSLQDYEEEVRLMNHLPYGNDTIYAGGKLYVPVYIYQK